MIIKKTVTIKIGSHNYKHFLERGYKMPLKKNKWGKVTVGVNREIEVNVSDLMSTSMVKLLVKCEDCGKERFSSLPNLVRNKNSFYIKNKETPCKVCAIKRLGGVKHYNYKHGIRGYTNYAQGAKQRGYTFNLTTSQFTGLIGKKCYYCGDTGGGIDRVDNTIGYEINNCVSCCRNCNYAKRNLTQHEFLILIKKIYEYQN